ncbi:transporter substrate-binding domain-containing protein [Desulfogranum mediterraneum]|uniref:transporter substrate-binding domain-containing protein n=1 Tax=Desulfogranum mediterraneum TaxID=160661 RepID=UPI00048CF9E9|nr:transporter substrate-binding domain-containing protein [Desulfogranum mediterraneum]
MLGQRRRARVSVLAFCIFSHLLLLLVPLHVQAEDRRVVRVAARSCPPFVIKQGGSYGGLSMFLLDHITDQLGLDYSVSEYGLSGMIRAVAEGEADVAVSCLSITKEREKLVDFSHSFYETHLAIAVKQRGLLQTIKGTLYNKKLLVALGIIVGVAILIGGILFLLEHKVNDKLYSMKTKSGKAKEAFLVGLLFATTGPIRYYEFKTLAGRILAGFLAVGSTVLIASITALLASAFTLNQLHSEISGPQDLGAAEVGVLQASTSLAYLQGHGITAHTFKDRKALLQALDEGRVSAIVGDNAVLRYKIRKAQAEGKYALLSVLPFVFEKQNYGFALQDDSPGIEKLNQALLAARDDPGWEREVAKYIGSE